MPKIMLDVQLAARMTMVVTKAQLKRLEAETEDVAMIIDETEVYNRLSSEGEFEFDWDYASLGKTKKLKAKR